MLKNLPEEVLNLWNNWEIRGMILLSLLLQTILIIFGPLRKTIASVWIRILVWSAYLSADMVATVALGNLAGSQGDSSGDGSKKANNSIQTFWAPFLLLHLGGPDTITAYSIEDNELWLRHLLGLVVQVVVAFYVFSRSWGSGILQFIGIPMFIAGFIKYSERTWVLWSSCSKSLRNSSLSGFRSSYDRTRNLESDQQREYLRQAYTFFHISKFTMQDLAPPYWALLASHLRFSKIPADGAFKVLEVELGLIYDMLYTKAPLIYSCFGIILRCISFLLSVTAFIIFQVKIEKHAYSSIDVAITYLLLAASVFLELYAFLCLVLSDRTMIWLLDKGGNALTSAIYSRLRKLTTSKRWSRCISQYNLISSSIGHKQLKCLKLVGVDEMMRQMHVNRKGLNGGLQKFIFEHLLKKAKKMKENFNLFDKNLRSKIIGQRGDGVLEREGLLKNFKWCTTEVEFSRSILVWHVATEICSRNDKDASNYVSRSKCLSEYMMYLLVIRPNMLSKGFGDEGYLNTLMRDLRDMDINQSYSEAPRYDDAEFRKEWKTENKSAVFGGRELVKQLLESISESKKRWEMIEEVWMEMLTHGAAHCPWKEHAHALRRGGELLTHVSFLMLHLGLSQQYEYKSSDKTEYKYYSEVTIYIFPFLCEMAFTFRFEYWGNIIFTLINLQCSTSISIFLNLPIYPIVFL
ncbi:Polysulfide reductase chain [Salix suchowensis]|nr:Polysulfide reductase chain [Salix suchowensis]